VNEEGAALIRPRIRFAPLHQLALTGAALGELGAVLDPLRPLVAPLFDHRRAHLVPGTVGDDTGDKRGASASVPRLAEAGVPAGERPADDAARHRGRALIDTLRRPANLAFLVVLAVVASGWWVVLRPTSFFGGTATFITVKGTSMLPTLKTGDFVLAEAQPSYEVGDLVVYRVPRGQIGAGDDLIHRIVAGNATIGFTLRGDNNPAPDPWTVPRSDVLGKESLIIPGLGNSLLVIRSPLFAGLVAALIAMWVVISPPAWRRRRKPAASERDPVTPVPPVADHAAPDHTVPDPATPVRPVADRAAPDPAATDPAMPPAATTPARRRSRTPAKPAVPTPRPTTRARSAGRTGAPRREP
jgi:signal peptidase I